MAKKNLLTGAVASLIVVLGLAVFYVAQDDEEKKFPEKVKVAVSLPLTLDVGRGMLDAALLALDQAEGKAGDIEVELVSLNSSAGSLGFSPELEVAAAQVVIKDETLVAFLGSTSSDMAKEVIPILNPASLALVSPAATWPGLTRSGFGSGEPGIYYPSGERNFFRVIPSDDVQGRVAAEWMRQQGIQRVYIVTIDHSYSRGLTGILEANAEDKNLEIIEQEIIDINAITVAEAEEVALRVVETHPDAVYYPIANIGRGYIFVQALQALAPDIIIVGGDGFASESLPDNAHLFTNIFATNTSLDVHGLESATAFIQAYEEAYDISPDRYALATYEAMTVILMAIEQADEPTPEGVLKALKHMGEYDGAMGTWHFDENGDTSLTAISIQQLVNGEWVELEIVQ